MLAYRHAFHAGNHADVLKHAILVAVLRHLNAKPAPWRLVDTHAGAGRYHLADPQAQKKGEYRGGVARLWAATDLPPLLEDYRAQLRAANPDGQLAVVPGSPALAMTLARPQDQLRFFELHPTDHALLATLCEGRAGVQLARHDGFAGWRAQLPPPSRRGLLLVDPPYELKTDYAKVATLVAEALQRFAEGMVLVWLPQLSLRETQQLPLKLKALANAGARKGWLHARLTVGEPDAQGFGLFGSSVFVINPPHTLRAQLAEALPVLVRLLGQGPAAAHRLELSAAA